MGLTVLVFVDEDAACNAAAFEAARKQVGEHDRLIVVYARPKAEVVHAWHPWQIQHFYAVTKPLHEMHDRQFLEVRSRFSGRPETREVKQVEGAPEEAIPREAKALRADLLVMAERKKHSLLSRLPLSSVKTKIVQRSPCSVLLVSVTRGSRAAPQVATTATLQVEGGWPMGGEEKAQVDNVRMV